MVNKSEKISLIASQERRDEFTERTDENYRIRVIKSFRDFLDKESESKGRFDGLKPVIEVMAKYSDRPYSEVDSALYKKIKSVRYGESSGWKIRDVVSFEFIERFMSEVSEGSEHSNDIRDILDKVGNSVHFFLDHRGERYKESPVNSTYISNPQTGVARKIGLKTKEHVGESCIRTLSDGVIYKFEIQEDMKKVRKECGWENSSIYEEEIASILSVYDSFIAIMPLANDNYDIAIAFDLKTNQLVYYGIHLECQNVIFMRRLVDGHPFYLNYLNNNCFREEDEPDGSIFINYHPAFNKRTEVAAEAMCLYARKNYLVEVRQDVNNNIVFDVANSLLQNMKLIG